MSENNETETSAKPTDQTTSTTSTTETTTESPSSDEPSLLNQAEGEEGSEGAADPSGDADFTPLTQEDISLPEGLTVDKELMGSFLEVANEAKMPKEVAQKLVDLQTNAMQKASESISQAWSEMQEQWREEVKKLPEFGGENLSKTTAHISRLIESFGGTAEEQKALRQVFDFTGAGNNPQMIAFLGRLSKELVTEGVPVTGQPSSQKSGASLAERMFPDNPSGRG